MLDNDKINNQALMGFSPVFGKVYSGEVVVKLTTILKLGGDVSITINGVSCGYLDGEIVVLRAGIKYTFDSAVNCHVMA